MSKRRIQLNELKNPWVFLATGFGSGLAPVAPGTVGSLVALLFVGISDTSSGIYILSCLFAFQVGIFICERASKALDSHDHSGIVWDEFVGIGITFLWVPLGWPTLIAGFVLFRFFDILKPWPIGVLDKRMGGGFGIMIDDVVAGVFANIGLQLLLRMELLPLF